MGDSSLPATPCAAQDGARFCRKVRVMRCLALCLACLASPVAAEQWQVMFLADSGGSRPMQVDPADLGSVESVWMEAYVDNDKGERLFLDCRWTGGAASDYDWTLRLFPGRDPTFLPKDSKDNQFIVTFDGDDTEHKLGDFTFVQEAFWAPVPDVIATEIITRRVIRLEMPGTYVEGGERYRTEFSLVGSGAAIDKACPPL
jgi:hypothetical protein